MCSRCTPFGLFAGLSVGYIDDKTKIVLGTYKRHSRLDMQFLCTLTEELSKLANIKENIQYYPNTSIYKIGKLYRYMEYQNTALGRRYCAMSVESSIYLDTILKIAKQGIKIEKLLNYLIEKDIENDDALKYIDELIDSQILVSSLTPSVTGDDYFSRIINILSELDVLEQRKDMLIDIQKKLERLDTIDKDYTFQQDFSCYHSIIKKIKELNIPFEESRLFQVDMTRCLEESKLGNEVIDALKSAIIFLDRINSGNKNDMINEFKQAFYNRYEDREIPLMEALDPEIGIGYSMKSDKGIISPLLDDFNLPNIDDQTPIFQSNEFISILLKKIIEASKTNNIEIILYDDDIKGISQDKRELPPTLYAMFNILRIESKIPLIYLHGFYGISGAKILTRFAHINPKISEIVNNIVAKENELCPNQIFAEIAHLPESRIGNVLTRPHIRNYEIPYLTYSNLPENRTINLSDILISIKGGRVYLRSKKIKKEIIPRLTNAHNYSDDSSLPVYKFLSDIQQQGRDGNLLFNWGYLNNELRFLPRVVYKNIILSLATWNLKIKDIKWLFDLNDDSIIQEIRKWREKEKLPLKMILSDYDNELFIDWEEKRSIKALFSIIKNKKIIKLKEFVYDQRHFVVKDMAGNPYMNECLVPFYKKLDEKQV